MAFAYHGRVRLLYSPVAMPGLLLAISGVGCTDDHTPPRSLEGETSLEDAPRIPGAVARSAFGHHVACAGDVDRDGNDDLIVGAAVEDTAGDNAGGAYLFSIGGEGALDAPIARWLGERTGDEAGISVAGAGDVDGDGAADVLVGAWNHDPTGRDGRNGAAYLFYGPASGERSLADADVKLGGEAPMDQAGFVVAAAGDLDHDGLADIAISAFHGAGGGKVYLYYGPVERGVHDLGDADVILVAEAIDDHVGLAIAGGGDLTGDGIDDLAIGAPFRDGGAIDSGSVYLIEGATTRRTAGVVQSLASAAARIDGVDPDGEAGTSLAIGDVDGDGHADLAIGSPTSDRAGDDAGAGLVVRGPVRGAQTLAAAPVVIVGDKPGDMFGISVAARFDRDRDGRGDLLIGAFGADEGETDSGAAYLFYGPLRLGPAIAASQADAILPGTLRGDGAGSDLAVCGGEDRSMIAIGAPGVSNDGQPRAGAVLLVP